MICGIGTDIVDVGRIRKAVERWGDRFLKRVFTEAEVVYCLAKANPYPHLAARFAAKEAVMKALSSLWGAQEHRVPTPVTAGQETDNPGAGLHSGKDQPHSRQRGLQPGHLRFKDIEISNRPSGQPFVRLRSVAWESLDSLSIHLSMSHEHDMAIAMVVLEKASRERL